MKALPTDPVYETIRKSDAVFAQPRLIAEWNYNRYLGTTVTNTPTEESLGYDPDIFPIESIVETERPGNGIVKARIGEARVSEEYVDDPNGPRYYLASDKSKYKYWTSPEPSGTVLSGGGYAIPDYTDGQPVVRPTVVYDTARKMNKIVVGIEDNWSHPVAWTIRVRIGGAWSTIDTNGTLNSQGRRILYFDGTDWTGTRAEAWAVDFDDMPLIEGIRIQVDSMHKANSFFNLIEISGRLERNVTEYLQSTNESFTTSADSFLTPIGKASSNTGTVTLFNDYVDGVQSKGLLFNNENAQSPLVGLIDANVKFTLEYLYDTTEYGGTVNDVVNGFVMYADGAWQGQRESEVTINLKDYSKFLEQQKPLQSFHEGLTAPGIVWRLCDSVGFNDYVITERDDDKSTTIPFFWVDGERTLWEIFAELAEATQMAVYFDAQGNLQVKTRRAAYNETTTPVWTFRAADSGEEAADIITLAQTDEYEANVVKVNYQETEFSDFNNGFPKMDIVWQPEGTVALRSAPLTKTLDVNDVFVHMNPSDARIWPFRGIMQIQGELIRYDGKQYRYYEGGVRKTVVVNSDGELRKYRDKTPALQRHKNGWTGKMKITTRGLWSSEAKRHPVDAEGYNVRRQLASGSGVANASGFRHHRDGSFVRIRTAAKSKARDFTLATRGQATDSGFYFYGTKMRFVKGPNKSQMAGIVIHNNAAAEAGYYIELRPTRFFDAGVRKYSHEVAFYSKTADGVFHRVGGQTAVIKKPEKAAGPPTRTIHKGIPHFIREDDWIELDIAFVNEGGQHKISIAIDGQHLLTANIASSETYHQPIGGKFGMYARGDTTVDYEYLYAISRQEQPLPDDLTFFDRIESAFVGQRWHREWVWRIREEKRRSRKGSDKDRIRFSQMFMDEFGPYIHEVREFDVKFEQTPVLHSRLYSSNDYQILCPEYRADSFTAQFLLANASRDTAIAHGEDTLTYGPNNPVNHNLLVYARSLIQKEAEHVTSRDEDSIRKRGRIDVEISNPWIQTKEEAKDIGEWINTHWANGAEEFTVEVFGNPLLETTDPVLVNFPKRDLVNVKCFVTAIQTTFDGGMTTSITLRRSNV